MRRLAVVGGAVLIFAFIGLGFARLLHQGQPPLPPAPSCSEQLKQWRQQVIPEIAGLALSLAGNDQKGIKYDTGMLWAVTPPRCVIRPKPWHNIMNRLDHQLPLDKNQVADLRRITTIDYQER